MSYQCLSLSGLGYSRILDGAQVGLDMGLSDFMMEAWIKTVKDYSGGRGYVFSKSGGLIHGRYIRINTNNTLGAYLAGTGGLASISGSTAINDGRWHYAVIVGDRSGNGTIFLDATSDGTFGIGVVGNLDSNGDFQVGALIGAERFTGLIEEVRIWNFGYAGLPADYAAYITWRSQGRHRFLPLADYAADAWIGYADADRTNPLLNPDFEAVDSWPNRLAPTTNARSGVQQHGGAFSRLIVSNAVGQGARQDIATTIGHWYEVSGWVWVMAGDARIGKEDTDGTDQVLTAQATLGAWNQFCVVFQATAAISRIFFQSDTVAVSTFYVDDMEVHQIGLVSHYKFENNLLDEGSNNNDLTAGGTGNLFPTYSLKREKIIMAGAVNPAMGDRR